MSWQTLLNPEIKNFIRDNENTDLSTLGLQKLPNADWDKTAILNQIKSRQKAQSKIPQWLPHDAIIFPEPDIMEQASSAATALYKAQLIKGQSVTDLTGGAGVDSWAFLKKCDTLRIVDIDPDNAAVLDHNLKTLCNKNITVHTSCAEAFIKDMPHTDVTLVDPMRRTSDTKGRFKLEECRPNILKMLPKLLQQSKAIILKTSPMLDITSAIETLAYVHEAHIIEYQGDCKELVFILKNTANPCPLIKAVKINQDGQVLNAMAYRMTDEQTLQSTYADPKTYLYEPGPAFQKSGGFKTMAKIFNISKLSRHTHLYTSDRLAPDFPGRIFKIEDILPVQAKALKITKANITIRNFPMNTHALRKKLKLKDGGPKTLFACTLQEDKKVLIQCEKVKSN